MLTSSELFYSAPLYQMWEQIDAGLVYSGTVDQWLIDTSLNCRSCDDVTVARCTVATWCEFNKLLTNESFKCQCGGVLTRESAIVKVLTKSI